MWNLFFFFFEERCAQISYIQVMLSILCYLNLEKEWYLNDIVNLFFFFRLVLKCRSRARKQFAALRSDVLVKLELLDNKHFQDMVFQLKRLLDGLAKFHIHSQEIVSQEKLFPIEVDWAPPELEHQGAEETGFD